MDYRWYELIADTKWAYANFNTGEIVALIDYIDAMYIATKYTLPLVTVALGSFVTLDNAKIEIEKVFR
jgi:hypothetical protein